MMRVLLDTHVLVCAAIRPDGMPGQILDFAVARYELLTTDHILAELADVLARPHLQKKYQALMSENMRERFLALVRSLAEIVTVQTALTVVSGSRPLSGGGFPGLARAAVGEPGTLRQAAHPRRPRQLAAWPARHLASRLR